MSGGLHSLALEGHEKKKKAHDAVLGMQMALLRASVFYHDQPVR
jgi:hypothetical protein